jgi:hypothetical protein
MTDSATQSKNRRLLQRLRNNISHREPVNPSRSPFSTKPPKLSGSKQKTPAHSGTQSSTGRGNANSDLTAQASSHTGTTTSSAQGHAAASTLCEEILEKALNLLEEPERVIIEGYISSDDNTSSLDHAFETAQAKRKVCENKRWVFTVGSHTLRLQDEADKVILWLDRFKQVGDVVVNADQIHAGLPGQEFVFCLRYAITCHLPPSYLTN